MIPYTLNDPDVAPIVDTESVLRLATSLTARDVVWHANDLLRYASRLSHSQQHGLVRRMLLLYPALSRFECYRVYADATFHTGMYDYLRNL